VKCVLNFSPLVVKLLVKIGLYDFLLKDLFVHNKFLGT